MRIIFFGTFRSAAVGSRASSETIGAALFERGHMVQLVSSQGIQFAQGSLHESFGLTTYLLGTVTMIGVARVLR